MRSSAYSSLSLGLRSALLVSLLGLTYGCDAGRPSVAQRSAAPDKSALRIGAPGAGVWSPPFTLPLVPSAAANLPNGKIIFWAGDSRFDFGKPADVGTSVAVFDPQTSAVVESQPTLHEMFCPGTTNLPDGRLMVVGGSDSGKTSIYDPTVGGGTWNAGADLNIPRAYNANTLLQDGSVLTLGGSWSGSGDKDAEVWTEATGWRKLLGVPALPMLTADGQGVYRSDNHMWLIPMADGRVLQAGPSAKMHWVSTEGEGAVESAGTRGIDADSMSGVAVMYDVGKVLTAGGSPNYEQSDASANVHVIDTTGTALTVQKQQSMMWARVFHNAVVLPNGQVVIVGGQTRAQPFNDTGAVLTPELWDPATGTTTALPPMTIPRTYHSLALLLRDGRVLSAGSGLCGQGCGANHPEVEILTPPYLLNADGSLAQRPEILSAPTTAVYGTTITVTTNAAVTAFALVRLSSSTHTVNNDQRRVPLTFEASANNAYTVNIPSNPGIAIPGDYMLFALDADGVPSVATDVRIGATNVPKLTSPGERWAAVGVPASLVLTAVGPATDPITYSSTPLPPALVLDANTGAITGTPSTAGVYAITVFAQNSFGKVSTNFVWRVTASKAPRFARLEEVTEIYDQAWGSMAEFNLVGPGGDISRAAWQAKASSTEPGVGNAANRAIDGDPNTIWHTQYNPTSPRPPHNFIVNMNASNLVTGFRYLPRAGGGNGSFKAYRFYLSIDGVNWGDPVAEGSFIYGANEPEAKTVMLPLSVVNEAPVVNVPAAQSTAQGQTVSLPLVANDPENDDMTFSATGLPAGLTINEATGLISGTITAGIGAYEITVSAQDGEGLIGTATFTWSVASAAPTITISPVAVAPHLAGTVVDYTAQATGTGLNYAWHFGDGTGQTAYADAASAQHTFATAGVYPVTLLVRDSNQQVITRSFSQAIVTPAAAGTSKTSSSILVQPTAESSRIWVANPDSNTVSVFGGTSGDNAKLAEIAVGVAPATLAQAANGDVWVVNRESATISVMAANFVVTNTIALPRASRPFGIVFSADGPAYVALEATGSVVRISAAGVVEATADVGPSPRHLALDAPGARLLVSRFITAALPGESTASVQTTVDGVSRGGEVAVVPLGSFAKQTAVVLQHNDPLSDSTVRARGVPNYLGGAAIAPDGSSAWVPSKQDNIKRGQLRDQQQLNFQSTVRAISSIISLSGAAELTEQATQRVDHDNSGVASAAVFHPSGAYLFVALETSRQVAVVDPFAYKELFRFSVGRAPQGLALSPDGLELYVSNFMDRSVSVIDLAPLINNGESRAPLLRAIATTGTEALSADVLVGKQLFYDAADSRLARDAYVSCASCHRDGEHDGRTWDLTGFGEGLRNTISLRGRGVGHGRSHWTGNFDEVQDFEGQIRALSGGTGLMTDASFETLESPLGAAKAGASADLDKLTAYVNSLTTFLPSPSRTSAGALTAAATAGREVFVANCNGCHGGSAFTNSSGQELFNVGTLKTSSGTRSGAELVGLDAPTLRDAWATAPYLHDGSAATIADAVRAHSTITLTTQQSADVSAFVEQVGVEEPAVQLGVRAQYIRLQQDTALNGAPWSSMAELNLTDTAGVSMAREGWTVSADSYELVNQGHNPEKAIDGDANTIWHTQWSGSSPGPQHWFVVNLGSVKTIGGFRYLPRQDGTQNGTISQFKFFVSMDGTEWGDPVASGDFSTMGAWQTEKLVLFK